MRKDEIIVRSLIAALLVAAMLVLGMAFARADDFPIEPVPVVPAQYLQWDVPRHIYRDGQYFFCPYPTYDPYCLMPNDYSWALEGPPWRRQPYVPHMFDPHVPFAAQGAAQLAQHGIAPNYSNDLVPGPAINLGVLANRAIHNALRPKYQPPAAPPTMSMEQEREWIIRQGEAHCAKFPQDTQVCHPQQ